MKKIVLWIVTILAIFIILVFLWFKSNFNKDEVEAAKKDEFIQLLGGAKLEFMGNFNEEHYDSGGYSGPNSVTFTFKECSIAVYKINNKAAKYLEKTKAKKEVATYFSIFKNQFFQKISNNKDKDIILKNLTLYFEKYKVNEISKMRYSTKKTGIKYFDKESLENGKNMYQYDKYYKKYTSSYFVPDLEFEKKIKCLFDNDNYYIRDDLYQGEGFLYYLATRFNRKYPYYFSFYSLNSYKKKVEDNSGFYVVIPDLNVVYVVQPKYQRIFKLY
ncbi:hypothetical protein [Acinetobacter sp. ANC 3791]|uniref:hypothetical protein n=1 Tax=Acinetobacter sp. ANC 3791 TaxID=2529836 RepID=UPI00103CAF8A|nr:hypothetical protein [Acinetobacter sp. ANC 3791]TCB81921.1 hypothetical protein E0H90_14715 [Acinetobacter sp. ANC 3791]